MTSKTKARARVQITIEISVPDTWGDDCPIGQVHRQAKEAALDAVQRLGQRDDSPAFTFIGEPKVTAVLTEERTA